MHQKIVELRSLLAEKFPADLPRQSGSFSSGLSWLDAQGGLLRGGLIEMVRPKSGTGSGLALVTVLRHSIAEGRRVALIDGADSFDPENLTPTERKAMLWVRCREASMAIRVTDLLLRDGNLPVVLVDLAGNGVKETRHIPSMTWHRLHRIAEESGNAAMIFSPSPIVSSAACRFELTRTWQLRELAQRRACLMERMTCVLLFSRIGKMLKFG